MIKQEIITLGQKSRGFHLVTAEIISRSTLLHTYRVTGLAHLLLLHTSASLSLNENADPTVRSDFEVFSNALVPEHFKGITHTYEGSDDMPAHIKSAMYGVSITIPIREGSFLLGTWQGIYLNEHRNRGGSRKLVLTIIGEEESS